MSREINFGEQHGKHHIAAIAHLFLGGAGQTLSGPMDPPVVSDDSLDDHPADHTLAFASGAQTELFFAVASADHDHLAAATNAALAQRAGPLRSRPVGGGDGDNQGIGPASERIAVLRAAAAKRINGFNLGPASETLLTELEARRSEQASQCGAAGLPEARDGLIWCVGERAVTSLTGAYRLGRLAACCAPRKIIVVVFPSPAGPATRVAATVTERCTGEAGRHRREAQLRTALPQNTLEVLWLHGCEAVANSAERGDPGPLFDRVATALFAPCAG